MTTTRPISSGTGCAGFHHIAKVVSACNCILHPVHQENDIGTDAFIEFVLSQVPVGCMIAAQIKSGPSYIRNGRFTLPADAKHFEYWRSHPLPVCGFVYDPASDTARWVDLTEHVNAKPADFTVELPDANLFDQEHFPTFRDHFLSYRDQYSAFAGFGRSLSDFSHVEDTTRCENGIRALFSFHRSRIETWYYVISAINNFRGHPLLRLLVVTLAYVPGHMDIFWIPERNTIPDSVTHEAKSLLKRMLNRESVLTLLGVVEEGGFERGAIGQCVAPIIALAPDSKGILASIALDPLVPEATRYWALLLLILSNQRSDPGYCLIMAEKAVPSFTGEDHQECARGLLETLKSGSLL